MTDLPNETGMNRYCINGKNYFARDEETAILQFKCDYQFRNKERTQKPHPTTPRVELKETEYTLQPYATQLCDDHRETLNAAIVEMNAVMRMPKSKRGTCADHIFQIGGYDFLLVADDTLTWIPNQVLVDEDRDVSWYSLNSDEPFPCMTNKSHFYPTRPHLYFVDRSKGLVRLVATLGIKKEEVEGKFVPKMELLDCLPEDFCVPTQRHFRACSTPTYANFYANFELSSFLENAEVELQDLYSVLEKECA